MDSTTERIAGSFEHTHNFGSVSDSLGRLTAASQCMASIKKVKGPFYMNRVCYVNFFSPFGIITILQNLTLFSTKILKC